MAARAAFSDRTALLIRAAGLRRLAAARVCVFGLGGVGAACAVDLVRAGVGHIRACDFDLVGVSNFNRLVFGYQRFVGMPKALAFKELAREINPEAEVEAVPLLIRGDGIPEAVVPGYDFYVDCIDSLNSKANLIAYLSRNNLPFVSSMGTAGRLDPGRLRFGSLWDSSGCPLARAVRQRLRRLGLDPSRRVPCVWSDETPVAPGDYEAPAPGIPGRPRRAQASAPFVPQAAGHLLAYQVVRGLGIG